MGMSDSFAISLIAPRIEKRSAMCDYSIDVAASYGDVAERWRALRESGSSLAFQSETWLSNWYDNLSGNADIEALPITIVDRRLGDVLALPLVRRRIGKLAYIEFADGGLTDYNAPIIGSNGARIDPAGLMKSLRAALPRADVLRFGKMPDYVGGVKNPLAHVAGARACRLNGNIIRAPGKWDEWHWGLERTFRKELERSWRVFERRGGTFRRVVDLDDARRVFAELKRLQRARIGELGYEYTLDEPRNDAFYDNVVETGIASGDVILTTLEADGEMVGGLLSIAKGDHYSMTRLAAAGGDWKNVSPGRLVIERTMKHLHGEGFRLFDFTIGEYAYKRRLGVESVPLFDLDIGLSWRGLPIVAFENLKRDARENPRVMAIARRLRGRKAGDLPA
jgi:CelD/BcsL family acetyltransferase involved in cellulose biosynthesis